MKKIVAFLFLTLAISPVFAQVDAYSEDVKQCIKSNGTYAYYENVVDQMFTMVEKQYESKNVPAEVWTELKSVKKESLAELSQMIVSAYKGLFTHQDVKNMNALYKTNAGKNMFKQGDLSEGDKVILNEFYASDTGQKIVGSQDEMNAAMSKIAQMWSSDLYKSVINKLSEKGYDL
ncbi:DUF2059 domain-containing protein [Lacinutrix salivirga]